MTVTSTPVKREVPKPKFAIGQAVRLDNDTLHIIGKVIKARLIEIYKNDAKPEWNYLLEAHPEAMFPESKLIPA